MGSFVLKATLAAASIAVAGSVSLPAQAQQDTLRVAVHTLPTQQGNPYGIQLTPAIFVGSALYDGLVLVNNNGIPQAALATSWKLMDDKVTWQFKLRPNTTFDNGRPLTARAIVDAINYLHGDGKKLRAAREVGGVASAEAVDDLTVNIVTKNPDAILPKRISQVFIPEPQAWVDLGEAGYAANPIATGSYKFESWQAEKVVLVARQDSWRPPKIGRLEFFGIPEQASRSAGIASGQIDLAVNLGTDDIDRLKAAGQQVVVQAAPQVLSLILPNKAHADSPFNDVRVRRAANYAVNKQIIADNLFAGQSRPGAGQGATARAFGYNPNVAAYPYDPAKAKQLLTEAGFPNGFKLVAEVTVGAFAGDSEMYQAMAADLGKVGIETELRQIVFPDWLKKYLSNGWEGKAFGLSWLTDPYVDSARFLTYISCAQKPAFFCDEETQKMIDASHQEFDPAKREKMLQDVAASYHDLAPAIWLVEAIDIYGLSSRVKGFRTENRWLAYHDMA
ncbi:MAG: ABC transporter substrate-binding protein, partial [Proteobacteria bacterium]|nr:ABC transporter substrate-binding protein [Pseudomonadota bacterium]